MAAVKQWWRAHRKFVLRLVLLGVGVGLLWRLVVPLTVDLGDSDEISIGVDLTLAALGLLAGTATALAVLLVPGARPVGRVIAAVLGSALAGAAAWGVGDLVGRPALNAYGAVLTWPVATAVLIFASSLVPAGARRYNAADPTGGE